MDSLFLNSNKKEMGIKYLNKFLRENVSKNAIKCIPISELSGKKIAVDISIYMFKFVGESSLVESMYIMLSLFRHYKITPIFVFDGKPPAEKKELLIQRRENRKEAENEFNSLKQTLDLNPNMEETDRQEIYTNMDQLKKQFIVLTKQDIQTTKDLIISFGATYYDAHGEADELCALLVHRKKVWGCLSEDTDMFVYGCENVLRYFSLLNHRVVLYNTKKILTELKITQDEFRELCVLSGTDYSAHYVENEPNDVMTMFKVWKHFQKYQKEMTVNDDNTSNEKVSFYLWLQEKKIILHFEALEQINQMFDLNFNDKVALKKQVDNIQIRDGHIQREMMQNILKEDGFVFPCILSR